MVTAKDIRDLLRLANKVQVELSILERRALEDSKLSERLAYTRYAVERVNEYLLEALSDAVLSDHLRGETADLSIANS